MSQSVPAEYLQSAIAVADARAQQGSHQGVVAPRKEPTLPRILTIDAVADGEGVLFGEGEQRSKVREVELAIGVGEGNAVETGGLETSAQRGAITAVARMA